MSDKPLSAGRLCFRMEGEFWNAYWAMRDNMDQAIFLASIRLSIVTEHPQAKVGFMVLMQETVALMLKASGGAEIEWGEPRQAPPSERGGHA